MVSQKQRLNEFFRHQGLLLSKELERGGLAREQIARLVEAGELQKVARGLYALPDYTPSEHEGLMIVTKRQPRSMFCLLTALRFHELTTQAPFEIWVALGKDDKPPRLSYPPIRVVRYSPQSLAAGVKQYTVDNIRIRITDIPKTIADCFKYRHRIGLDVALEALREAYLERNLDMDKVWQYAKINRVAKIMQPYLKGLS